MSMKMFGTLLLKGCHKKTRNYREYIQDVWAWLIAALGAERITRCDSRHTPHSATRRAARMSESHAGTS